MDCNYDTWWLEEVRDHYNLFKITLSVSVLMGSIFIVIAAIIFTINDIEGLPAMFLLIFLPLIIILMGLVWYLGKNYNKKCLVLAYTIVEILNFTLFIGSISSLKEHKVLLCIGSTVLTLLFQLGFIKNLKFAFLVILKHLFLWYTSRLVFGEISSIFPISYQGHIVIIMNLYVSEYLKRKKSFEKFSIRKQLEETKKNLKTVLDCFPNGLIVFDVQLNVKYANRKILEYFDCDQTKIVSVLNNEKYIHDKRHFQGINLDNLLINDIEKSFDLRNEEESDLGLTSKTEFKYL